MTDFHDREMAEEAHWNLLAEQAFRVRARRDHLVGLWAAQRCGMDDVTARTYASEVTNLDVEKGQEAMVARIVADLQAAAEPASRHSIEEQLKAYEQQARESLVGH